MLGDFFKKNDGLIALYIRESEIGADTIRHLSLALGSCNESLKSIFFNGCHGELNGHMYQPINDDITADIIEACTQPHLKIIELSLIQMNVGRNSCAAVAPLLHKSLQYLDIRTNNVDDVGVDRLIHDMNGSNLRELNISNNRSITVKKLATMLKMPGIKLENLVMSIDNIGVDEGALIIANALAGNCTLKNLHIGNVWSITAEGWTPFSKLLCDTSSVNKTYLSNHTLADLSPHTSYSNIPNHIQSLLDLNKNENKGQIATRKILKHHSHFNVQPFFEWEFKVLPLLINWFANAATITTEYEERIKKMKLSVVYEFIKEFPMLYIEPMTRKEVAEYTLLEEQLQGSEMQEARRLEVQQCKARAMRRLDVTSR